MSIRVFAPAKVNLTLEVGLPRSDGRHPLASLVMFADIGDAVFVREADALTLTTRGPFAAALADEPDNLVLRAARLLQSEAGGQARGAAIQLDKQLPIASGIGGGSSDAAATLKALSELWELSLTESDLCALGARLGADVPACIVARAGFMSGAGETFTPLNAPPLHVVLANAGIPISTAEAYRAFDARELGRPRLGASPAPLGDDGDVVTLCKTIGNDLEDLACALEPSIADVRAAMCSAEGVRYVALSGSGGTWFALMDDAKAAEALANELAAEHPQWWARAGLLGGAS